MEVGYQARAAAQQYNDTEQEAAIIGSATTTNPASSAVSSTCSARNLAALNGFERPRDMIVYWLCEKGGMLTMLGIPSEPFRPFTVDSHAASAHPPPSKPRGKDLQRSRLSQSLPPIPSPPLSTPRSLSRQTSGLCGPEVNTVGNDEYLFLGMGAFVYDGQPSLKDYSTSAAEWNESDLVVDIVTHRLTLLLEAFSCRKRPFRSHTFGEASSGNVSALRDSAQSETHPHGTGNGPRKRSRGAEGGGGDDDDGGRNKRQQAEAPCKESDRLRLACPFYKFDPVKYRPCYRFCKFRGVADMKQHLLRCHRTRLEKPEFSTWALITDRQWASMNEVVNERKSGADKWFDIYGIFFPGAQKPSSPYLDGAEFWEFLHTEGNIIFQRDIPEHLRLHIDIQQFYERFVESLWESWTGRNSALEQNQDPSFQSLSIPDRVATYVAAGPGNPARSSPTGQPDLWLTSSDTNASFHSANPVFPNLPAETISHSADSGFYSAPSGALRQLQQPQQQLEVQDPLHVQRAIHVDSEEIYSHWVDYEPQNRADGA